MAQPETPLPADVQRIHQLAEHVELELSVGAVADAHGRRPLVAGEPVGLPLHQVALTTESVHDLEVGRIAGDGT